MKNKNERSESRDQAEHQTQLLLRAALPAVHDDANMDRDLWPAMLRRMDEQASRGASRVPWFDWALGGALLAFAAMAPRTIPVILYYL